MTVRLLNFFLSSLQPGDLEALSPGLTEVSLSAGQFLYGPGDKVEFIYFPGSACVSLATLMLDGKIVETSTVGRESGVGLMDVVTEKPAHLRAFVQVAGSAMRLPAAPFRAQFGKSPQLLRLTMNHMRAFAVQAEQGVACNVTHEVRGRLARWLLMTQDRVGADSFPLTQEYMAVMTGVQRSTVSLMAGALKKAGLIDYSRGMIRILDREALLKQACECYAVVEREFESLRDHS